MKYVYRIVNALLAAVVFPAALLQEFVLFRLSTSIVEVGLEETLTLKQIIGFFLGTERLMGFTYDDIKSPGAFEFPKALDPVKGYLIATVVAFALALVAAIFIIIWSICSNKRIPVIVSCVLGIAAVIVMNSCFNSAVAPIVEGSINVVSLFSSGLIASLLGKAVFVDTLCFAGFQNGIIIAFIAILLWTAAFYVVEIGDTEEASSKKAKKSKK